MVTSTTGSTHGSSGAEVRDELKGDAQKLKNTAQEQGEAKAREGKEQVARSAHSASSAIDAAADKLRDDNDAPAWMASAFSSAARQVDDLASRLQDKSPRDIARETNRFGRENPTAFLAASAALGFAAARFLRAGAEYHAEYDVGSSGSGSGSSGARNFRSDGTTTSRDYSTFAPQPPAVNEPVLTRDIDVDNTGRAL